MNSALRFCADQWTRIDLYWRCRAAMMQGHMARVFMTGRTYLEGTEEHEAWRMGHNGTTSIYISSDFRVKALN